MKPFPRLLWLCLPLALAACQDERKTPEAKTAQGEILPGSASDAMLPLDSVRSQPPLAPRVDASGKPGKSSGSAAKKDSAGGAEKEEQDEEAEAAPASPEPAAASSGDR